MGRRVGAQLILRVERAKMSFHVRERRRECLTQILRRGTVSPAGSSFGCLSDATPAGRVAALGESLRLTANRFSAACT